MMETLFYLLKVILASGILYGYYQVFLKDKTFHHYNRFYLLMILPISLLLPLLKVSYFTLELNPKIVLLLEKFSYNTIKKTNDDFYFKLSFAILGLFAVFFLAKFLYGIFQIQRFRNRYPKEEFQGINFFNTNLENAPFSFFRNLFWKESILLNSDLGKQILKHEMVHIEQKHSVDKILIEIVKCIFWFNPFFWLIKKELHLIHEYLADKKAVQKSNTKAFAEMLLASHFSGKVLPGSSPFLNSNLKKRLQMLQKSKTKFSYLRKILVLPLLFILAFAYLVNAKNKEIKDTNELVEKTISQMQIHEKNDTIRLEKEIDVKKADGENDDKKRVESTTKTAITTTSETRSILEDGEVKYSASAFYQEGEPDKSKIFPTFKDAKESDEFDIMEKKVSKKEFYEFLNSNLEYKDYVFGFNNVSSEAKKSFFIRKAWTKEEGGENLKELREKLNREHIEKLNRKNTSGNIQNTTDNPWILNKQVNTNEYEVFFKSANEERLAKVRENDAKKQKLITIFKTNSQKNEINKNFYKGRDYDANPLTEEEITALKEQAEQMRILTQLNFEERNNESYDKRYAFFKTNQNNSVVYDTKGDLVKNENKFIDRVTILPLTIKNIEYYIDGKKVSKEKFLEYKADANNPKSFLEKDERIKSLRETKVSNGEYSYAMKFEILTQ